MIIAKTGFMADPSVTLQGWFDWKSFPVCSGFADMSAQVQVAFTVWEAGLRNAVFARRRLAQLVEGDPMYRGFVLAAVSLGLWPLAACQAAACSVCGPVWVERIKLLDLELLDVCELDKWRHICALFFFSFQIYFCVVFVWHQRTILKFYFGLQGVVRVGAAHCICVWWPLTSKLNMDKHLDSLFSNLGQIYTDVGWSILYFMLDVRLRSIKKCAHVIRNSLCPIEGYRSSVSGINMRTHRRQISWLLLNLPRWCSHINANLRYKVRGFQLEKVCLSRRLSLQLHIVHCTLCGSLSCRLFYLPWQKLASRGDSCSVCTLGDPLPGADLSSIHQCLLRTSCQSAIPGMLSMPKQQRKVKSSGFF